MLLILQIKLGKNLFFLIFRIEKEQKFSKYTNTLIRLLFPISGKVNLVCYKTQKSHPKKSGWLFYKSMG